MKLLLSCTELGLGHVTRLIPLGKKLAERGHELHFFSGGTAYQLLKKEFENVYPCTPVTWYETTHGLIASASVLNILFPLPYFNHDRHRMEIKSSSASETVHRYYDLRRHIRKIKPDLIMCDGDMHALRLAHRWRIPSVYVTNIIRPSYAFSPLLVPGERFTERYVKKSTRIIIPDDPPPYTICEHNLGDLKAMNIRDKVEFVGSFIDMTPSQGREEHIFAPISGPLGTRAKLTPILISVLREIETKSIISLGQVGSKIVKKIGNCEVYTWLTKEERYEFMANARLVVFSGGHATCFETVKHCKPSVIMPTQPEQDANGWKMKQLGCTAIAKNGEQLKHAFQEIAEESDVYKSNVERLNKYANKFRGLDQAAAVIENIL